jgi:hypothetical protein
MSLSAPAKKPDPLVRSDRRSEGQADLGESVPQRGPARSRDAKIVRGAFLSERILQCACRHAGGDCVRGGRVTHRSKHVVELRELRSDPNQKIHAPGNTMPPHQLDNVAVERNPGGELKSLIDVHQSALIVWSKNTVVTC